MSTRPSMCPGDSARGFCAAAGLILLVFAVPCLAQQAAPPSGLTCAEPFCRFGDLGPEKTVRHTFMLTNAGPREVRISAVRAGCGCLAVNLATNTVAPGGTLPIEGVMTLAGRKGPQRKAIYVETGGNTGAPLRLEFEGTVVPPLDVRPEGVHFGTLAETGDAERDVMIVSTGTNTFRIRNVTSSSPQFKPTLETAEAGNKFRLRIQSAGPRARGTTTASVRVETDHPAMPVLVIPVTVFVAGDVVAAPSSLMLIESATNTPRTYYVTVYSPARKAFKVAEVQAPRADVESRVAEVAADRHRVELRFPGSVRDLNGATLRIRTDMASVPEILVPLRVIAQPGK